MAETIFDPSQYLSSIRGQQYLEVKWRLAWLRAEHPDAVITTHLASHQDDRAIFSAEVTLPEGGSATGWGSETSAGFGNYIERRKPRRSVARLPRSVSAPSFASISTTALTRACWPMPRSSCIKTSKASPDSSNRRHANRGSNTTRCPRRRSEKFRPCRGTSASPPPRSTRSRFR